MASLAARALAGATYAASASAEGVTVCALASCRAAVTAFWGLLATWVALARERIAGAALEAGADSLAVWMLFTTSSSTLIEVTEEPPTEGTK